jgi:phospholipase C
VPPDSSIGEYGFDFKRFGVRVPTVLVSPRIAAGTVFRVATGTMPLDHTSILKTVERRWQLSALTARDAAAQDIGAVLTLQQPRTDDPLEGVAVPTATTPASIAKHPSHLQQVHAQLLAALPIADRSGGAHHELPQLRSNQDYRAYIRRRSALWKKTVK